MYNDREQKVRMIDYYKSRGMYDPGFAFGMWMTMWGICAISCMAIFLNCVAKGWTTTPSAFLSVVCTLITFGPYINYKHATHIPRRERKAIETAKQQEIEMRTLRVRERELGLEPYEFGSVSRQGK